MYFSLKPRRLVFLPRDDTLTSNQLQSGPGSNAIENVHYIPDSLKLESDADAF